MTWINVETGRVIVTLLILAGATQLTRWLPFWIFRDRPPAIVSDLNRLLPAATMGLLVVYCLKDVTWSAVPYGGRELLSIAAVVILHYWRGNVLLSIAGGTALYMLLLQFFT